MPLTQTGSHGELFRLSNATFDITGAGRFMQTATSGTEPSSLLSVPPGVMSVLLEDGWSLQKSVDNGVIDQLRLMSVARSATQICVDAGRTNCP